MNRQQRNWSRPNLITRQEVADLARMSYDSIYRNERRLGLYQCRVSVNERVIFYNEAKVIGVLVQVGILESAGTLCG